MAPRPRPRGVVWTGVAAFALLGAVQASVPGKCFFGDTESEHGLFCGGQGFRQLQSSCRQYMWELDGCRPQDSADHVCRWSDVCQINRLDDGLREGYEDVLRQNGGMQRAIAKLYHFVQQVASPETLHAILTHMEPTAHEASVARRDALTEEAVQSTLSSLRSVGLPVPDPATVMPPSLGPVTLDPGTALSGARCLVDGLQSSMLARFEAGKEAEQVLLEWWQWVLATAAVGAPPRYGLNLLSSTFLTAEQLSTGHDTGGHSVLPRELFTTFLTAALGRTSLARDTATQLLRSSSISEGLGLPSLVDKMQCLQAVPVQVLMAFGEALGPQQGLLAFPPGSAAGVSLEAAAQDREAAAREASQMYLQEHNDRAQRAVWSALEDAKSQLGEEASAPGTEPPRVLQAEGEAAPGVAGNVASQDSAASAPGSGSAPAPSMLRRRLLHWMERRSEAGSSRSGIRVLGKPSSGPTEPAPVRTAEDREAMAGTEQARAQVEAEAGVTQAEQEAPWVSSMREYISGDGADSPLEVGSDGVSGGSEAWSEMYSTIRNTLDVAVSAHLCLCDVAVAAAPSLTGNVRSTPKPLSFDYCANTLDTPYCQLLYLHFLMPVLETAVASQCASVIGWNNSPDAMLSKCRPASQQHPKQALLAMAQVVFRVDPEDMWIVPYQNSADLPPMTAASTFCGAGSCSKFAESYATGVLTKGCCSAVPPTHPFNDRLAQMLAGPHMSHMLEEAASMGDFDLVSLISKGWQSLIKGMDEHVDRSKRTIGDKTACTGCQFLWDSMGQQYPALADRADAPMDDLFATWQDICQNTPSVFAESCVELDSRMGYLMEQFKTGVDTSDLCANSC